MKKFTVQTIAEADRDHIIFALAENDYKLRGRKSGAAYALDVPPTTLSSKMKQRGVFLKHDVKGKRVVVPKDKTGKVIKQALEKSPINLKRRMKSSTRIKTVDENLHDHISMVLKMSNGKVAGKHYAADLLGVPTTTLRSKIIRLDVNNKRRSTPIPAAQMAKLMREYGYSNEAISERLNQLGYTTADNEKFTPLKVKKLR